MGTEDEVFLQNITSVSEKALALGTLLPLDTNTVKVTQQGLTFIIRTISSQKTTKKWLTGSTNKVNPFKPYDRSMYIGGCPSGHVLLLNKYKVIDNHFLIVTSDFVPQQQLLTSADFEAVVYCLEKTDGVIFFNGGNEAGASQLHKHLQCLPKGTTDKEELLPFLPLFIKHSDGSEVNKILPELPFRHRFYSFTKNSVSDAEHCFQVYQQMLADLGIEGVQDNGITMHNTPYNIIITRDWMLIVPRKCEHYKGVSQNSLAFTGSLLAQDDYICTLIQDEKPLSFLLGTAFPAVS
jgi:ATP adenylyltransferase